MKYKTNPAPEAANTNPKYSNGLGACFGGCSNIENKTFTSGAPVSQLDVANWRAVLSMLVAEFATSDGETVQARESQRSSR